MRKLLFFLFIFPAFSSFAAIKTVIGNTGQGWGTSSNWFPSGVPADGDEVIIPFGITISVKGSLYTGNTNLTIKVLGTLDFDPSGKLELGTNSSVQLLTSQASITSSGTSSELIIINGVTKYNGNLDQTVTGPAFATGYTATSPSGFLDGVLPVKLTSFSARPDKGQILLDWTTAEEIDTRLFQVERSGNAIEWSSLESIAAKGPGQYRYIDPAPNGGVNFYRLKSIDENGTFQYSDVIKAATEEITSLQVGPNPATSYIKVFITAATAAKTVELMNASGNSIKKITAQAQPGFVVFDTKGLPRGSYYILLRNERKVVESKCVMVQ